MNEELYHHGVKGMKWGVRRYQNKSGGLTPAGKKRYSERKELRKERKEYDQARKNAWKEASAKGKGVGVVRGSAKTAAATAKAAAKSIKEGQGVKKTAMNTAKAAVNSSLTNRRRNQKAREYRKSDEYKRAYMDEYRRQNEKSMLTPRERDKLYRDVKGGKKWSTSYFKRGMITYAKMTVATYAATAAGAAAIYAGKKFINSRKDTNPQLRLPASTILEAKVHSIK